MRKLHADELSIEMLLETFGVNYSVNERKKVSNHKDHTLIIKDKQNLLTKEETEALKKTYANALSFLTSPYHTEIKITGKKSAQKEQAQLLGNTLRAKLQYNPFS